VHDATSPFGRIFLEKMTPLLMKLSAIYETECLLLWSSELVGGAYPDLCENPIGHLPVHLDRVLSSMDQSGYIRCSLPEPVPNRFRP
jgi:hypothetical protein